MKFLRTAKFKWLDWLILAVLIAASFSPFLLLAKPAGAATTVEIKVSGKLIKTLDLSKNQRWTYDSKGEINKIEVSNRRVRVYEANCRDQIDVKAGWISKNGQTLVCLPHSLVVALTGGGPVKQDGKVVDYQ